MNVYEFGKYTQQNLPVSKVIDVGKKIYNTSGAIEAATFAAGAVSPLAPLAYTAAAIYGAKQVYDYFSSG